MARIEWVHLRLENWALWHERGAAGGLGFAACSIFANGPAARGQVVEARIPVDELDASVTHEAVESLKLGHGHLYQTLRLFYLRNLGVIGTARSMRRAESTIHSQLGQVDQLLATWFTDRSERKRVQWRATQVSHALPTASQARERRRTKPKPAPPPPPPPPPPAVQEEAPPPRRRRPVLTLRKGITT